MDARSEVVDGDTITIRSFEQQDAAAVAQVWNESEEGWNQELFIPYTAEYVLRDALHNDLLEYLLLTVNGKVVGTCTIGRHHTEHCLHVNLINVHPAHYGRGFGRRLLVRAVDCVAELDYERVDLYTWAGNVRAVPAYKRTGFFWMPGSGTGPGEGIWVYMQNYIPAILSFPVAAAFFREHPDWYQNLQSDLTQQEDDLRIGGMKALVYRWQSAADVLIVTVDRPSCAICGIEDNRVSALSSPDSSEAVVGGSQRLTWRMHNKTSTVMRCSLSATAGTGLEITRRPAPTFDLPPHKEMTLAGEVQITSRAGVKGSEDPAHQIHTALSIDRTVLSLRNGLEVKEPIELDCWPEYVSGYAGSTGELSITIKNNTAETAQGVLWATPPARLAVTPLKQRFEAPSEGCAGARLQLRLPQDGGNSTFPLRLFVTRTTQDGERWSGERTVTAKSFLPGGLVSGLEREGRALVLENEVTRVQLSLEVGGAIESFQNKLTERNYATLNEAVGPPFVPDELEDKQVAHRLVEEPSGHTAILDAELGDFAGLRLRKAVTLFPAAAMLKVQYSFTNASTSLVHDFHLRVRTGVQTGGARLVAPLKDASSGNVAILAAIDDGDFPEDGGIPRNSAQCSNEIPDGPEHFAETWSCVEFAKTGEVFGLLWSPDNVVSCDNLGRALELAPGPLEPQASVALAPMYLVGGYGTWHRVRELWRRLIQGRANRDELPPAATSLVRLDIAPPTMETATPIEVEVTVANQRAKALSGDVVIEPPAGWSIEPRAFAIEDVAFDEPHQRRVVVSPEADAAPGSYQLDVGIDTKLTTIERPLHLVVLGGGGSVRLSTEQEPKEVFVLDNGRLVLRICPEFAGRAYSLVDRATGADYLHSTFPELDVRGGEREWYGGMGLMAWMAPANTTMYRERFRCEKVERGGWIGVSVTTTLGEHVEKLRGLTLEQCYLTRPQSNVIARTLRVDNQTTATLRFTAQQELFVQAGGVLEETLACFRLGGSVLTRRRLSDWPRIEPEENWLQAVNERTKEAIVLVSAADQRSSLSLQEWGVLGLNLGLRSNVAAEPGRNGEILSYIIIDQGMEAYSGYRCLERSALPA